MRNYKLLPHTADIKLYVEADTIEELFRGAMKGMMDVIKTNACQDKTETITRTIEVESLDQTELLIDFLSEVLTYTQEEAGVFCRVKFLELNEKNLKAQIFGREEEKFNTDVKGVTYHDAQIKKNKNGNYEVTIVFDI
jgi:SHS2 domain-containing protein